MYGPSRLIWFAIGSVATLGWVHHRDNHVYIGCSDHRREREGPHGPAGYGEHRQNAAWGWHRSVGPADPRFDAQGAAPKREPEAVQSATDREREQLARIWDAERERMWQMGRNAEETISGMSEATIDSMLSGLQRLKERLAERRGQQVSEAPWQSAQTPPPPPAPSPEPLRPRHLV
ncbi:hypothetical protein BC834DRAFT_966594 [Gloeopeniophorella convolvens]|nr:hypothetical protein BC834DRAFT_966594 [Gloeopeniophorella convolvens]